jgi:hypothetical protein
MHDLTSGTAPVPPHRKLALAVIVQAFRDAANPHVAPAVRAQATRFLSGSAMLAEWCALAGLDAPFVRDVVARYLRAQFRLVAAHGEVRAAAPVAGRQQPRRQRAASSIRTKRARLSMARGAAAGVVVSAQRPSQQPGTVA